MYLFKNITFFLILLQGVLSHGQKTAVVIVDMQPYFSERGGNDQLPDNAEKMIKVLQRQVEIIKIAREEGLPIVIVEFEGAGETNPQILEAVVGYQNMLSFTKSSMGMFEMKKNGTYRSDIKEELDNLGITDLVLMGANGHACVFDCITQSLRLGYKVWIDNNAVIDFNRTSFKHPYFYYEFFANAFNKGWERPRFHQFLEPEQINSFLRTPVTAPKPGCKSIISTD